MGTPRTGGKVRRWGSHPLATVGLAVLLAAADTAWAQTSGRVIYMAAIEMKGGTQQDKEPYPEAPLPPGAGYEKTPPNRAGRWEVSAYRWSPGTIVVQQGETITLEIVGINGDVHPATIPGIVNSFTVKRGQITRVTFTATKAGLYPIICTKHQPNMQGTLVVLPK
jgi:heme/copper-type cytochrome/quinol oxidase subunit 2